MCVAGPRLDPALAMTEHTVTFLRALMNGAGSDRYLEVRYRRSGGMGQLFFAADAADAAARVIHGLGARTDVYIGVAPRVLRAGGRSAVAGASVVWADCDTPDARVRLQGFAPAPSLVVRSGSPGACHAYWILDRLLPAVAVEHLNRRLAAALGADAQSVDIARVLRPPGTRNFKHTPPAVVELAHHCVTRVDPGRLDRALPQMAAQPSVRGPRPTRSADDALLAIEPVEYIRALLGVEAHAGLKIVCPFHHLSVAGEAQGRVSPARSLADASSTDRASSSDLLLLVPPPVYFERLTGLRVGRSGKLNCLFHDDRTPSLHVYREPKRGWYCFGCGRGGSVYDLAALLTGRSTRGQDFLKLRRKLEQLLLLP